MRDGDPQVVAASIFVVGSIALGLQPLGMGVDNLASPGTPVPIIIFAVIFVFARAAFFLFITIASFRLPLIYTAIFGLVVVALVLVGISYLADPVNDGLLRVAGAVILLFAALGMSLSLTVMNLSLGGPARPPLGKPIIRPTTTG